ncbi:MAG: MMPL family transporter [Alphaproteobacteria bacterium]|nr:MMPL family transporter [Alphaproteobacteria bacterium]
MAPSPLQRTASLILRARWVLLLLILALSALAVTQVRQGLRVETSPEYFASGDAALQEGLESLRQDFGRDDLYLVLVEGEVFTPEFIRRLRALHEAIEALELPELAEAPADDRPEVGGPASDEAGWDDADDAGWDEEGWGDEGWGQDSRAVSAVTSLINARQVSFEGGALRVRGLLEAPPAPEALPALREAALSDPTLVGQVVGAEGQHAVLAVQGRLMGQEQARDLQRALIDLAEAHAAPGFQPQVTGMPALELAVSSGLLHDMRTLGGIVFALMGVVLYVLFRHPVAVLGPLLVAALAVLWTLGWMAATGTPITLVSNIIPAFILCVGLGDSVHVQSVFRDQREAGRGPQEALVEALSSTGPPVVLTTLTTMVGLLSFRFASTRGVQEMGLAAAFGVGCAMLLSLTLLPLALSLVGEGRLASRSRELAGGPIDRLLATCTGLSATPKGLRRVALGAALLVTMGLVGLSQVRVYHDPMDWLPAGDPTRAGLDALEENVGGTASFEVLVDADGELGVKDLELLRGLEGLEAHLRGFEHPHTGERIVSNITSLLDVLRETNRALAQGDPAAYRLPDTQRGVSDALLLFESASPRELTRLATADLSRARLSVRLDWMDATSYLPLVDHVAEGIRTCLPPEVRATATGSVYALVSVTAALIQDLMRSFGAAAAVILLMMVALLRSLRLGLIGVLPNLLAVGLVLGLMGAVGIPIDLATLLIASIVIGVAVDDSIHYLHQYRVGRAQGLAREDALRQALRHAGRALVSTSLILAIGFSAFLASSLANVRRFGLLVAAACILALLCNLILLPALLRGPLGDADATR